MFLECNCYSPTEFPWAEWGMPVVVTAWAFLWRREAEHFLGDPPPFFLQTVAAAPLKQPWTNIYEVEPKYYPVWCTGAFWASTDCLSGVSFIKTFLLFLLSKQRVEKHTIIWNQEMCENSMTNFLKYAAFTINIYVDIFIK